MAILEEVVNGSLPPLYIIIDEYDNFTNQLIQAHNDGLYKSLTSPDQDSFLKSFFKVIKAGLESNAVRRCYITGVLPITIDDALRFAVSAGVIVPEGQRFSGKEVELLTAKKEV